MSRRGRRLREFADLIAESGPGPVEPALEVLDYIREAYGDVAAVLGGGVYGLYTIALMYALRNDKERLRAVTLLLSDILDALANGDEEKREEARKKLREVLSELEALADEAIGGG